MIGLIYFNRIVIPINPAFKKEDVKFIVKNSKPDFIITEKEYDFLFKSLKIKKSLIQNLNFLKKNTKENFYKPNINSKDFAQIVYTSGSTGNPKGVLLSQKNVISQILSITKHFKFKSKEKFITILPLFHNGGQFFQHMHL